MASNGWEVDLVGLGNMGSAMAAILLSGYSVTVYYIDPARVAVLEAI